MQSTQLLSNHNISTNFASNAFKLQNTILNIKMPSYTEVDIEAAIMEVYEGRSVRKAAIAHGIPYTTLSDRLRGAQTRIASHVHQQRLSPIQEKRLVDWILGQEALGFPLTYAQIREFAVCILKVSKDNNNVRKG